MGKCFQSWKELSYNSKLANKLNKIRKKKQLKFLFK